ncbi:unnamed protein product, partial [Iphiclides podalirius]
MGSKRLLLRHEEYTISDFSIHKVNVTVPGVTETSIITRPRVERRLARTRECCRKISAALAASVGARQPVKQGVSVAFVSRHATFTICQPTELWRTQYSILDLAGIS